MFRPSYLKEGPGITPEQAQDRGARRFFRIYFREFFPLMGLNLLFLVCCLPVATVFPAWKALCTVTSRLVAGENVFYLAAFRQAFTENLSRTFLGGVALAAAEIVCGVAVAFYSAAIGGVVGVLLAGLTLSIALFVALTAWCFYPLSAADTGSGTGALLKKSCAFGIVGLKYNLPCVLLGAALVGAAVLFFPLSAPFVLLWLFSFLAYLCAYALRLTNASLLRRQQLPAEK